MTNILKNTKARIAISLAVCAVLVAVGVSIFQVQKINSPAYQLSLGEKYLLEGNYEEAILAFTKVIEVEPANAAAYLGMADAYIGMEDYEKAKQILEDAYARLGDEALQEKIREIRFQSNGSYVPFERLQPEHQAIIEEFIRLFREDDTDAILSMVQEPEKTAFISSYYDEKYLRTQIDDLKMELHGSTFDNEYYRGIELREKTGKALKCSIEYIPFNSEGEYMDETLYFTTGGQTENWNWNGSFYAWESISRFGVENAYVRKDTGAAVDGLIHGELFRETSLLWFERNSGRITGSENEQYSMIFEHGMDLSDEDGEWIRTPVGRFRVDDKDYLW